eukprot:Rhum_TRINITY_DN9086_c0_g1::Rhum_TRINITY_DN9086_c0_g1_i1::g.31045::m.31045
MGQMCSSEGKPAPGGGARPSRPIERPTFYPGDEEAERVYQALAPKQVVNKEKQSSNTTQSSKEVSEARAGLLATWMIKEWKGKRGTILTELHENLDSPLGDKILIFAKAAGIVQARVAQLPGYKNYSKLELLVMTLYTMAGQDIDCLMGFDDAPLGEGDDRWGTYKVRNQAVFRVINGAMRAAGSSPATLNTSQWPGSDIKKWIKTIMLLTSLAAKEGNHTGLSRGLAGLPAAVVADHSSLAAGDVVVWSSLSSCALDPAVSKSYIEGAAANATQSAGGNNGCLLFQLSSDCGLELQEVSKYPKEAEVLLPCLSMLGVQKLKSGSFWTLQVRAEHFSRDAKFQTTLEDTVGEARRASKILDDADEDYLAQLKKGTRKGKQSLVTRDLNSTTKSLANTNTSYAGTARRSAPPPRLGRN